MSFSLRWLFAVVGFAAIFAAALVYRTELWGMAAILLAIALLLTATLGAWVHRFERSFWIPFCVVGWFYLLVAFTDPINALVPYLPSTYLDKLAAIKRAPQPPSDVVMLDIRRFGDILHALCALLLAGLAGGVSALLKHKPNQ